MKRHYYYCRSKRPDSTTQRRRSCAACVRAKTRCTWLADTRVQACTRCDERGTKCDFQLEPVSDLTSRQNGQDGLQLAFAEHHQDPQEFPRTDLHEGTDSSQGNGAIYNHQSPPMPFVAQLVNSWDNYELSEVDPLQLASSHTGDQVPDASPTILSEISDTLVTGISSLQQNSSAPTTSHHSDARSNTKPRQVSLISLVTRILRSYPYMLLENGTFPPFLSPQLYLWARSKDGPQQQVSISYIPIIVSWTCIFIRFWPFHMPWTLAYT